jgi:uncharacterized protein YyaL (SSP411 family)
MVLHGFTAAYRATKEQACLDGLRQAAEFLLRDLDEHGYFRSHGPFVAPGAIKTYTGLCGWALHRAGEDLGDQRCLDASRRVADAVLRQQNVDGWFDNNCLSEHVGAPLLHTIGYTLQGLLELGISCGEERYVAAVVRAVDKLLPRCASGFLHSRWDADWEPKGFSSCLTGAAQLAVVCYRLAQWTGDSRYRDAADAVLNYLKALQSMNSPDPGVVGALGGSFPLAGAYMRFGFPEWATKYLLDALMWQEAVHGRRGGVPARYPAG